MGVPFDTVWERIIEHAEEQFQTRTGQVFRYQVIGADHIMLTGGGEMISRSELARCYADVEMLSSMGMTGLAAGGPSYVWSILIDRRIRPGP